MPITTDLDKFRLQLGDDEATQLYNDDEAAYFLEAAGTVDGAVAMAVDSLVLRYAREFDTTIDGQSFQRSQIAAMLEKRSLVLTSASASLSTAYVTRADAYSDTISAEVTRAHGGRGGTNRDSEFDPCGYDLDPDHDIPA
jgi:hypothetical protein